MKKIISLILLVSMQIASAECQDCPALIEQKSTFIEKKQTELVADEEELNMVFDQGIDEIVSEVAQDANIIRYTITLFKDRTRNSSLWVDILKNTIMAVGRANVSGDVPVEQIDDLCGLLLNLATTTRGEEQGIMADITISMSDGSHTKDCCKGECYCASRYNGNCPCSLDGISNASCCGTRMHDSDDMSDETDPEADDMSDNEDDYNEQKKETVTICAFVP